jgi:hypothetical protein
VHRSVDEALKGAALRCDGNRPVIKPGRAGPALCIQPVKTARGQAATRPTRFVKKVHCVPSPRQPLCAGGSGDAATYDSDFLGLERRHVAHTSHLRLKTSSMKHKIASNQGQSASIQGQYGFKVKQK